MIVLQDRAVQVPSQFEVKQVTGVLPQVKKMKKITEQNLIGDEGNNIFIREVPSLYLRDISTGKYYDRRRKLANVTDHSEMVRICINRANLNAQLSDSSAAENTVVERFIFCATEVLPYLSKTIESTPFVKFMCEKLLPLSTWNLIGATTDDQTQTQLRLLKVFAELCTYCGQLENAEQSVEAIYNVLFEYMSLPTADAKSTEKPSFQFSHVECLLYALHTLGKQAPDYLKFTDDYQKFNDFYKRLHYLIWAAQSNQTESKTTSNIVRLSRDLYCTQPIFKTEITLSWVASKKATEKGERKRSRSYDHPLTSKKARRF